MRWVAFAAALACATPAAAELAGWKYAWIVVLGEVHDNPSHHRNQAQLVAAIRPTALIFEMLTPAQATAAIGVDRTDPVALGNALEWDASGWPDFSMYAPIFAAAPDAVIIGAALPEDQMMSVADKGAAAVFGSDAAAFGLIPLAPDDQATREAEQAEAHCGALPSEMLAGMVEVQRLRDAHFARVTLEALETYGEKVVLITGSGHARADIGVPAALRSARPDLQVWSLGQFESDPGSDAPFDAVIVTDPVPRPDPCLAFQ